MSTLLSDQNNTVPCKYLQIFFIAASRKPDLEQSCNTAIIHDHINLQHAQLCPQCIKYIRSAHFEIFHTSSCSALLCTGCPHAWACFNDRMDWCICAPPPFASACESFTCFLDLPTNG